MLHFNDDHTVMHVNDDNITIELIIDVIIECYLMLISTSNNSHNLNGRQSKMTS